MVSKEKQRWQTWWESCVLILLIEWRNLEDVWLAEHWDVTSRRTNGSSGQNDRTTACDDVTCPDCEKVPNEADEEVYPP